MLFHDWHTFVLNLSFVENSVWLNMSKVRSFEVAGEILSPVYSGDTCQTDLHLGEDTTPSHFHQCWYEWWTEPDRRRQRRRQRQRGGMTGSLFTPRTSSQPFDRAPMGDSWLGAWPPTWGLFPQVGEESQKFINNYLLMNVR